jgi:uncharacterized protein (DUF58 family)
VKPLWRILYRIYRFVSWSRHWMQRRFTRAGLGVLCAAVIAAILGPDSENNIAYQAFPLLVALLLMAVCCSGLFRARFSAARLLPRFGTVGVPLIYRISVNNLTNKPQGGLTLLENLADPRPSFEDWHLANVAAQRQARSFHFSQRRRTAPFQLATVKEVAVGAVAPNEQVETYAELTPWRRGVLRFNGMALARPDPLGLFRALATVRLPQAMLILPKRYPLPSIPLPGAMRYQAGGIALASSVGQSEEFIALRDYRHGDPMRHIHWRSWAKAGKPVVKEFEDEFFVRHALVLDTFTDFPHSDVFEEAISVAASFAWSIRTQESLLDLLFVGPQSYCFTAGRGLARSDQMLEILASVRPCRDHLFRELEELVLEHAKAVSGCICVLLSWNAERRTLVEKLNGLGVPLLVLVIAPPGQAQSVDLGPMRDQPDRFCVLEAGKVEVGLAKLTSV